MLGCFLPWTTYGTWLPGDERGWVNRHRTHGERVDAPGFTLEKHARQLLQEAPLIMDLTMRKTVKGAIRQSCHRQGWDLRTIDVRSNHVHLVVVAPEETSAKVMAVLKLAGRKALKTVVNRSCFWTRSGSTRVLYTEASLEAAIRYVANQRTSWMKGV